MYVNPTADDFKAYFDRDFPYGTDPSISITDNDINKAINRAGMTINPDLFPTQDIYTIAFDLLTAHIMTMNLRASSQGISGKFEWAISSKGVGSVSVGVSIPDEILKDPAYSWYTQTNYGTDYLMMVWPLLRGNMFTVQGTTQP